MAIVSPPQPFEHLVLDFVAYLEFERGLSRNTLEAYRSDLLQFGGWLERNGREPLELDHSALAEFVSELATGREGKPPAKPATLQRKVACLRSFHRHLRREGLIVADPTDHLKAPRQTRKLPQVLSRDEVLRLLEQPRGAEPPALRDRALLELMYACGLRASEAIDLDVSDLDLETGVLRARGKGSKERMVPIGSTAARARRLPVARPPPPGRRPLRVAPVRQPSRQRADPPGPLQDRPAPRAHRRPREPDEPAHAAPHVRDPPAGRRL